MKLQYIHTCAAYPDYIFHLMIRLGTGIMWAAQNLIKSKSIFTDSIEPPADGMHLGTDIQMSIKSYHGLKSNYIDTWVSGSSVNGVYLVVRYYY